MSYRDEQELRSKLDTEQARINPCRRDAELHAAGYRGAEHLEDYADSRFPVSVPQGLVEWRMRSHLEARQLSDFAPQSGEAASSLRGLSDSRSGGDSMPPSGPEAEGCDHCDEVNPGWHEPPWDDEPCLDCSPEDPS